MATVTKSEQERIINGMLDSIADHVESLPPDRKKRAIKAIRAYSFDAPKRPSKTQPPKNGNELYRE